VQGIFNGIRVLDFSQVLAGPTATKLLVELGAEVIKIEFAEEGDPGRTLPRLRGSRSGYHVQQNRGKRSLCLDLRDPRATELILDLVPHADVVLQNFAFGVIERLGLGYDVVSAVNPRIVMCNLSAFGRQGPLAHKPGYDPIAQAWAGVLHMLGYEDRTPILAGISPGDVLTGVHAFGGVAAALFHRERTGRGQEVSVSLLDAYATAHEVNWQEWSVSGGESEPIRRGNVHPVVGGVGVFETGDGYVTVAAVNNGQWQRLTEAMGRPELSDDPRFASSPDRVTNRDEVNTFIATWLATQPHRDDVVKLLDDCRVPSAPVLTLAEAAQHPYLHEAGAVRWVDDDVLGKVLVPGMPIKFSETPGDAPLMTRQLGEDNEYVTCELAGRSHDQYRALVDEGVLFHNPDS
jgi:crotonobetainyl-CoA:carnitine CoA-transferase CaiB-like acyl-CoA transferase